MTGYHDSSTIGSVLSAEECRKAARYAVRVCNELASYSKLDVAQEEMALLEKEEVVIGDLLGSGGFNHVHEVHRLELREDGPHRTKTSTPAQEKARKLIWKQAKQNPELLAVKFLNGTAMSNAEDYYNGAADLLLEARYLSILAAHGHPNIIRLHGIAAAGPQGFATGVEGGYFLLLDRLYDTLDNRLDIWKELTRRKKLAEDEPDRDLHLKALFLLQLKVGLDLSSALTHLHKLRIIFRDLKPDNVGFDFNGVLKVFDLGLAKELDPRQLKPDRTYAMSGATGSRRYMAPEVALSKSYHLSADVYSFGILLWEVLTFEKAYWDLSIDQHKHEVIQLGKLRPRIKSSGSDAWPTGIQKLLRECWAHDLTSRPSMKDVGKIMQWEITTFSRESGVVLPPSASSAQTSDGTGSGESPVPGRRTSTPPPPGGVNRRGSMK